MNNTVLSGVAVEIYFWTFSFYFFSAFFMNTLNSGAGFKKILASFIEFMYNKTVKSCV